MMIGTAEVALPAAKLRALEIGDRWLYLAEGSTARAGETRPVRGTIDVSIERDTLSGIPGAFMLVFRQTLEVTRADNTPETLPMPAGIFSFVQDPATGDALIVADNMGQSGACRLAKQPQVFYPGLWSAGTSYANRLDFGDGEFVSNTLAVTGQEWVESPAGSYLAWVAGITSENSAMGRITGTDWWTPELGAPVRFETDSTMPDGTNLRLRATLTATTVAVDRMGSIDAA